MLKFTRAFSLEHDIIPHIPVEQLPPEAKTFIEHNATVIGMAMGVPKLHNSSAELNSLPTFTSNPMLQTLPPNFNTPPARTSYRSNFRLGSSYSGLNSPGSNQNSPHSSIRYSHQPSNGHHDDDDDNDYGNNSGLLEDDDDAEGSNNDMNNFLNSYNNQRTIAHMINLRIIGRDSKSGILVIARNARINDIQKTCIDLFDINSKKYTNVLDYSGLIISATLSSDAKKSFLIFTVQLPDSSPDPNVNRLYSSFIYEMNKRNNIFHSLEKSSTHIPVYHCLHVEQKYLHLLSIQNDECSTIRVPIQDEKSNGYSLPPKFSLKKNSFTKKFFWYQYDDINHVLYVLQYLKLRSLNAPSENLLKKWVFREGKIHQSGEFPIFLNNTTDRVSSNFPYPFTLPSPKSDQVVQNIHIVQLDKLKFSIPLASIDGGVLSIQVTRVLFDSMGNYLLIFVPGHFLQLIDCSSPEHDPSIGITLYNLPTHIKEMTSHDSSDLVSIRTRPYPTKISTSILPFYVFSKSEQNLLFDYHHGILKSISNLFQKETIAKYGLDNGADLRALHLVMMHMQDSELVLKILVNVSNEPQLISSDLLKEYILGQTYLEMKGSKLDPLYLQALPMTCSDTMDISLLRSKLKDIELTNINWQAIHQIFLGNSNSNNKMIDPKKRLRSFEVVKQEGWQKESGSVVTSFIKSFFGVDDNRPDEISSYRRYESGPLSPTKTQANSKIPIKYALDDYEEDPLVKGEADRLGQQLSQRADQHDQRALPDTCHAHWRARPPRSDQSPSQKVTAL
ncbi:hypothetical protein DFA_00719 [Cavenderia fasciculata]|uniref:Uncharacterized protein n=1 Tax=Cavenderia fasciculata TaxID=261658 RepID=F4PTH2_CACFS|nr:uncharacterized protein DFA_00719 [Cavenderia fasciculata]EGG20854.1 hypothetical protein DFA_00719 [Cavenderia fasciculata]|eukprot:XP_004358704.1 hypothetical protein DFA_00719 [Cavenderia fasciculata]